MEHGVVCPKPRTATRPSFHVQSRQPLVCSVAVRGEAIMHLTGGVRGSA